MLATENKDKKFVVDVISNKDDNWKSLKNVTSNFSSEEEFARCQKLKESWWKELKEKQRRHIENLGYIFDMLMTNFGKEDQHQMLWPLKNGKTISESFKKKMKTLLGISKSRKAENLYRKGRYRMVVLGQMQVSTSSTITDDNEEYDEPTINNDEEEPLEVIEKGVVKNDKIMMIKKIEKDVAEDNVGEGVDNEEAAARDDDSCYWENSMNPYFLFEFLYWMHTVGTNHGGRDSIIKQCKKYGLHWGLKTHVEWISQACGNCLSAINIVPNSSTTISSSTSGTNVRGGDNLGLVDNRNLMAIPPLTTLISSSAITVLMRVDKNKDDDNIITQEYVDAISDERKKDEESMEIDDPNDILAIPDGSSSKEADKIKLKYAFKRSGQKISLISARNTEICRYHVECLLPKEWLSDQIVNFYLEMLQDVHPEAWIYNTFFWGKLTMQPDTNPVYNYDSVRKWTKDNNIFERDSLIFPLHLNRNHWACVWVKTKSKEVLYLDSLYDDEKDLLPPTEIFANINRYLHDEALDKLVEGEEWKLASWNPGQLEVPQQQNGYDCGVFLLEFVRNILEKEKHQQLPENTKYIRERILLEIMDNKIRYRR